MSVPVVAAIGCPGAGKTHLQDALANDLVNVTGAPKLTVDTGRVENFAHLYHAADLEDVIKIVWGEGDHCAYTPKDPEDFDRLMGAIYEARGVILNLDELKNVKPAGRPLSHNLRRVLGEQRRVLVGGYIGTQLYEDCGDALHGLATEWYFFRILGGEDRMRIRKHHDIPEETLASLPSAKACVEAGRPASEAYVHKKVGF